MAELRGHAPATAFFGRCADVCKEALGSHVASSEPDVRFQRTLLFALAILERCAESPGLEPADLQLLASAASDAAAVCRTELPSGPTIAVARCMQAVADGCCGLLDGRVELADESGWQRFLFDDADFDAQALGRNAWRVRHRAAEVESSVLDLAIEKLFPELSSFRIGVITIQVLDWYVRSEAGPYSAGVQ